MSTLLSPTFTTQSPTYCPFERTQKIKSDSFDSIFISSDMKNSDFEVPPTNTAVTN